MYLPLPCPPRFTPERPLNREILKNAFNSCVFSRRIFRFASFFARWFHSDDRLRTKRKYTSRVILLKIPHRHHHTKCDRSLYLFLLFLLRAVSSSLTSDASLRERNQSLVERDISFAEIRNRERKSKTKKGERRVAEVACGLASWPDERCRRGGPVVGVNVWNCFSRGHQEPFGVT